MTSVQSSPRPWMLLSVTFLFGVMMSSRPVTVEARYCFTGIITTETTSSGSVRQYCITGMTPDNISIGPLHTVYGNRSHGGIYGCSCELATGLKCCKVFIL
ncbi:unnamed protein product [Lymnaea stagnalis]|uniref:Uncharacterized protein n=1 Tax=Lymnaea stagnalis TaxID=6523 RepID=A0AAV2IT73_LYMST